VKKRTRRPHKSVVAVRLSARSTHCLAAEIGLRMLSDRGGVTLLDKKKKNHPTEAIPQKRLETSVVIDTQGRSRKK